MPRIVIGPLLRYVDGESATVWVETDEPCEVGVLDHAERTFCVEGHHYALVCVGGLEPGTVTPYEVRLDGELAWPEPGSALPPSAIRTPAPDEPVEIVFGSCRVTLPHEPPYTLTQDEDERGREYDALRALARRLAAAGPEGLPHRLLMLGDQVYVDEGSPRVRERIGDRREPPGREVANFEEYTWLYEEAWASDDLLRWLLSTVSTAMVWDDHDMHDDWNISTEWVREMREHPWWHERVRGGIASYWVYQHLGNLSPEALEADELYAAVRSVEDAGALLREHADRADHGAHGARWSWYHDIGSVRIVCMDSRAGRVLGGARHAHEHGRAMIDDGEWEWIEGHATGGFDHLLLGTSLPFLMSPGLHWLEAWSEAVCDGGWGRLARPLGERARRAADLEGWPAFQDSFHRLAGLVQAVSRGERGAPPASIVVASGDIHLAYLAEAATGGESNVWQAVCSPFRNALARKDRRLMRFARSRAGGYVGRMLGRSASVEKPDFDWTLSCGPMFDNQVATLRFDGRSANVRFERTLPDGSLEESFSARLA